jgi:hypothetical protein
MRITYQELPTKFNHLIFEYNQIWRDKDVAVYRQSSVYCNRFETIIVQYVQAGMAFGKEYPAREIYPYAESWGEHGFTYTSEEEAIKKARNLLKGNKARIDNLMAKEEKKLARVS